MFDSLKRLLGSSSSGSGDQGAVLSAWAKAEGHTLKRVNGKAGAGYVVNTSRGWRVEWGASQRPYVEGKELRFRGDTGLPHDVQFVMVSKVLAQALESDVFSRFTNAMQTQIDNTLPDEMRWLAMHTNTPFGESVTLTRRFSLFCNAPHIVQEWLDADLIAALEEAASNWWTDALVLVITLNRGMLTARMAGNQLEPAQLKLVGSLFNDMTARARVLATELATGAGPLH